MSLALLRRWSRAVALSLLVASLWGLPHGGEADDACAPAPEQHDESRHVITAVPAVDADHCAVCHWLRTLQPELAGVRSSQHGVAAGDDVSTHASADRRDPGANRLPARAPPAGLQ